MYFDLYEEVFDKTSNNITDCHTIRPGYKPERSSIYQEKDTSREGSFMNKTKERQSLQRSSKKDDHFTHKEKATSRQRSHSKDSNDDFTYPNKPNSHNCIQNVNVDQSKSSDNQTQTQYSNDTTNTNSGDNDGAFVSEPVLCNTMTSQPVVIDQILTSNELDLNTFIGDNRADPIVSSIEKSLSSSTKKPKVAANIFEAKRLMKIRKQIDLEHQKKIGNN